MGHRQHKAMIIVAHLQHRYNNTECRMQRCSRESILNRYQCKPNPSCPAPSLHACSSFRRIPAAKTTDPGQSSEHIMKQARYHLRVRRTPVDEGRTQRVISNQYRQDDKNTIAKVP